MQELLKRKLISFREMLTEELNLQCITEGLISSWDVGKLSNELQRLFGSKIDSITPTRLPDELMQTKSGKVCTVDVYLTEPLTSNEVDKLSSLLSLFGYTNSVAGMSTTQLQLEPKYPVDIGPLLRQFNEKFLYHITQSKYMPKIRRTGLAPRPSETTFSHPGNRVYLLYIAGDDVDTINHILTTTVNMLARNKGIPSRDMTVLRVSITPDTPYYIDDTISVLPRGIIGVFTPINIPPTYITEYII